MATDALARGIDSPALRELAGQAPQDARDNRDLFLAVIDELGLETPTEQQALWNLACATVGDIESGSVEPYGGARLIWWEFWNRLDYHSDLAAFCGLASDWEERPLDRVDIDAEIVAYAREFLANADASPSSRLPGPDDAADRSNENC